jgi:hypothetical protein
VSAGTLAMLVGVFGVPMVLLWLGHRLRRRGPQRRAAFWGGLVGYGIAACVALVASMKPPAMWSDDDTLRGLLGFWSLLVGPAAGALAGLLASRSRSAG